MKKNTNAITELVFIIDRSGSMGGLESDTIGGFNSVIEKQRKLEGKCYVTTVLFDGETETLHDRIDLEEIPKMTEKEYSVRGCTALFDAVGKTADHITEIHRYIREEDVPEHTMVVITTDGLENASHIYSGDRVKKMVSRLREENGWEFVFLGANIDSVRTAENIGISADRAADYHADSAGTKTMFGAVAEAVCELRTGGIRGAKWKKSVEADYSGRKSSR